MKVRGMLASALALVMSAPGAARAEEVDAVAAKFGALETIQHDGISLSPDGKRIAFIGATKESNQVLYVVDFSGDATPKPILTGNSAAHEELKSCQWSSDTRLICEVYIVSIERAQLLGFTRLIAINADGSKLVQVTARTSGNETNSTQRGGEVIDVNVPDKPGWILLAHQIVPEQVTGGLVRQTRQGLAVDAVDTVSLRRETVEPVHEGAEDFISDGRGKVRVMGVTGVVSTGYLATQSRYFYHAPSSHEWKGLGHGFEPAAVDPDKNLVYGFDDKDGFKVLASVALDGTLQKQVVLAKPGVDVDDIITIGRQKRIVGVSYATDRRTTQYFDPELARLSASLGKALAPGQDVGVIDASQDESKLVVLATGDTNPGMTYLYDKATRNLSQLLPVRAELVGTKLATQSAITFPAADGTRIPGYLTLPPGSTGKNLPAIVMPHGGPSARDEWGFDWLVQFFAVRGFAVLQPNYRGSAGFGDTWYEQNGFKSWHTAIGDVVDAGRWLVAQGIAAPGKLAIVGWSYGGYAALQSQVLDPDLFKAVVAVAPVTDLDALREESRRYMNFHIIDTIIGNGPYVEAGSPARHAAVFKAPVLLFHGDYDQNVNVAESRLMKSRLQAAGKQVDYIEFHGLSHQLFDAAARTRLLATSDRFLRKAMDLPQP